MIEPLSSPFRDTFSALGESITASCLICSPYISQGPVRTLVSALTERGRRDASVHILTDISLPNIVGGASDLTALLYLQEHLPNVRVSYLPRVHAKVYVVDREYAVIGSANWTEGGAARNYEYAVRVKEPSVVERIHADISDYAALGGTATAQALRALAEQTGPLRELASQNRRALRTAIAALDAQREREAQEKLIRIRVAGRSLNAIFCDTIRYLLRQAPLTTADLNARIQQTHPDLCDDTEDRVIDGVHYGKKWKHAVRGAQVTLRRGGEIVYDPPSRLYCLAPGAEP